MSDLWLGLRLFGRGAVTVLGSRHLLLLGAVPALIATVLYVAAFVALITQLGTLTDALTGFADGWSPGARSGARAVAGVALLGAGGAVAVVSFVAVTVTVGGPFYERLSEIVDEDLGAPRGPDRPWWSSVLRGARDGLVLVTISVLAALPLFALGFVPVIGQVAAPVLAALVGGRLLMIELSAPAFERRGAGLAGRRRDLRERRALTWGVGVPTYLLAAIPFVAVLVMPVGAAAATLLAREVRGERSGSRTSV